MKILPVSLWNNTVVQIWPNLVSSLRDELVKRESIAEASGDNIKEKEIQQGSLEEVALKHFIHRFKTSAARVEYVVLDPNGTFDYTSNKLLTSLFDGDVAILDIPCGSGGGLFGLICTIAEIRITQHTPPMPLKLNVLAADICSESRLIHKAMTERLIALLASVGIEIRCEYENWDVMDRFSTSDLMDRFKELYPNTEDMVVLVSAFSEFASQDDDKCSHVLEAIADIVKATRNLEPALAWIEPRSKDATSTLKKAFHDFLSLFGKHEQELPEGYGEDFKYQHPFNSQVLTGRAQVLPIERVVT